MIKTTLVAKTPDECPSFLRCNAQLCPLDKDLSSRMWYPDEDICGATGMSEIPWLKKQRKIARKCRDKEKYFTVEMLKRLSQVRRGTVGLNPDGKHESQLKRWLFVHPKYEKKERTPGELEVLRERMLRARQFLGKKATSS